MNKTGSRKTQNPTKRRSKFSSVVTPIVGDGNRIAKSQADAPANLSDQVSQTVDLSALENTIKQLPDVDTSRVVSLHERLETGEYCIDYEELVQKLLTLEEQLNFD